MVKHKKENQTNEGVHDNVFYIPHAKSQSKEKDLYPGERIHQSGSQGKQKTTMEKENISEKNSLTFIL